VKIKSFRYLIKEKARLLKYLMEFTLVSSYMHRLSSFSVLKTGKALCVRWNSSGNLLASASSDKTVTILDFLTGKTVLTAKNSNDGNLVT
jgi:WD40 repeat protein